MFKPDVADMQQPVINQAQLRVFYRSLDTAATGVAANDNMLNFQNIYRILNHGETVQIGE